MHKQTIIDKIKKLLALAASANEHEASLAMARAKRLMLKMNVQDSDLSEPLKCIVERNIDCTSRFTECHERFPWIVQTISKYFGGACVVNKSKGQSIIVGFPTDCEIIEYAIHTVIAQGDIDCRKAFKKYRSLGVVAGFWQGFLTGLTKRFKIEQSEVQEEGIILYDAVKQYLEKFSTVSLHCGSSNVAIGMGETSGQSVQINPGVYSGNKGGLLN